MALVLFLASVSSPKRGSLSYSIHTSDTPVNTPDSAHLSLFLASFPVKPDGFILRRLFLLP